VICFHRIRRLGLSLPPEEGSAIPDLSRLSLPAAQPRQQDEYRPDPYYDWVIDVEPADARVFKTEDVFAIFDGQWRRSFSDASVYGFSLTSNKWTYALAGGDPQQFGRLQIAVSLLSEQVSLQDCFDSSAKKIRSYQKSGATAQVTMSEPVEAALARSKQLLQLKKELHHDIIVVLKSDNFYPGRVVWDVLTETGLRWGDGDLFHWNNLPDGYGDDRFFSVWTSTAPGYFFPEAIKAGTFNLADLAFGYWVGRSADPMGVFEVLLEVADHCRRRLGGVLLGRDGQAFDAAAERARLQQIVDGMMSKDLPPGSNKALRLFQ
jgi:cell division protein ZipA